MAKLDIIQEALSAGVQRGALIHEKTGLTQPVEVVMAEDDRLLAIVQCTEADLERLHPSANGYEDAALATRSHVHRDGSWARPA